MTDQVPTDITLSSPRRTYPPSGRTRGADDGPVWTVRGVRYEFFAVGWARFFGVTRVWADNRHRVPIFDRERALLDAFHPIEKDYALSYLLVGIAEVPPLAGHSSSKAAPVRAKRTSRAIAFRRTWTTPRVLL